MTPTHDAPLLQVNYYCRCCYHLLLLLALPLASSRPPTVLAYGCSTASSPSRLSLPHPTTSICCSLLARSPGPLAMAASLSPQERTYYDQLYAIVDKDGAGVLPGHDALPFLVTSGLPQQTLGEIWAVADPDNNGFLTRDGWYKAARLIGWLQKGGQTTVDETLVSKRA